MITFRKFAIDIIQLCNTESMLKSHKLSQECRLEPFFFLVQDHTHPGPVPQPKESFMTLAFLRRIGPLFCWLSLSLSFSDISSI